MPIFHEIVLHVLSIWYFHESLLSTVTPRNLMNDTASKGVSSNTILRGSASMELLNKIYLVFKRLRDSLLALIH